MNDFPEIETPRLLLNALSHNDVPSIVYHAANKNISDRTLNLPYPYAEKDALFWINMARQGFLNKTQFIFGIRLKETQEFIGGIGLTMEERFSRAEIGYWLAEPFWNKGLATEALRAIMQYGFTALGLNKLTASYFKTNPASGRVMEKCGLKKEGELKEHVIKHGVFIDLIAYGLTKKEFDIMRQSSESTDII